MWGYTHTHSSPNTQAIFDPSEGPARRSRQLIPTYHRSAYSDQSEDSLFGPITDTHQLRFPHKNWPRGTEKAVSAPSADDVLAMGYY